VSLSEFHNLKCVTSSWCVFIIPEIHLFDNYSYEIVDNFTLNDEELLIDINETQSNKMGKIRLLIIFRSLWSIKNRK